MVRAGKKLLGYNSPEFIKDIGTPERYDKISAQFAAGIVAAQFARDAATRGFF